MGNGSTKTELTLLDNSEAGSGLLILALSQPVRELDSILF